jgi:hypothetical protein
VDAVQQFLDDSRYDCRQRLGSHNSASRQHFKMKNCTASNVNILITRSKCARGSKEKKSERKIESTLISVLRHFHCFSGLI